MSQINFLSKNINEYEESMIKSLETTEILKLVVSEFNVRNIL